LLNVLIDNLTMHELMLQLDSGIVFTLNLDHCYLLQRDPEFFAAYRGADFVTADSKYVYWSLGWLGRRIQEKICGSDIVPAFCQHHADNPAVKVFLLGAGPGVARTAMERINARTGRDIVVGAHVLQMVNASGATALIVGLGSPKQEIWIHRHCNALPGVRIFMGVGATIDYEAEAIVRAPVWMRRNGLEWLYRVTTQPKRYWRRYFRDLEFFWLVLLDGMGLYRAPDLRSRTPNASKLA
jgi:N-acetylglucosaminyldiphosphoundecaprenol N-acetyl-beta-D-mannosaminyltransferase